MDEEFFFPQNVHQTYRLWLLGPVHLKRLGLGAAGAFVLAWVLSGAGWLLCALVTALILAAYVFASCIPLWGDESTLWDLGREILRHKRMQNVYTVGKGVRTSEQAGLGPTQGP